MKPLNIKFENSSNPESSFDLITLESLFKRNDLNHNIERHHKVNFYIILFITQGSGKHTIDFNEFTLKKGCLLTIRKDQIHKFYKNNTLKGYLLLFTNNFLIKGLEKLESEKSTQVFNELLTSPKTELNSNLFKEISDLILRIEKEYIQSQDQYALTIIRSELHILTTKLSRVKSNQSTTSYNQKKYLSEFIHLQTLIENNITEIKKVHQYADLMAMSPKTLNNITREIIDKSTKDLIDEINVKQIKRLLLNTKLSIKEIAFKSGFKESTNFYKYFKKQIGITPEEFRQKN